jgi:hypothetical protein
MKETVKKNLIGAMMGFAIGLHVASTLITSVISRFVLSNELDIVGFFFFYLIIASTFSLFGIQCMSESDNSKNGRESSR